HLRICFPPAILDTNVDGLVEQGRRKIRRAAGHALLGLEFETDEQLFRRRAARERGRGCEKREEPECFSHGQMISNCSSFLSAGKADMLSPLQKNRVSRRRPPMRHLALRSILLIAVAVPFPLIAQTALVTTTADSGAGSLRDAITTVNAASCASGCAIVFQIPPPVPAGGYFTIQP